MRRTTTIFATVALCFAALGASSAFAVAPTILKTSFSAITEDSATLEAEINPGERVTKYHFEYGPQPCPATPPCTSTPTPEPTIPKGNAAVGVKVEVSGLAPGTTYHFLAVATNTDGKDESTDRAFTTFQAPPSPQACPNDAIRLGNPMAHVIDYSSANLPDCRAYEQASPAKKNAADATGMISWVKASPSGNAISFLTTSGIPGAEGLQEEIPFWLASRSPSGWSTQGLFAKASAGQEVRAQGWSPDFSQVFEYARKLGPPKEAAFLARSSVDGSLTEIFPYGVELTPLDDGAQNFPFFAGSTPSGTIAVFESKAKLTPEAIAGQSNIYAWERSTGKVRLVSILPASECATPPCQPNGAFAGPYNWMETSAPAVEGSSAVERGGSQTGNYTQDQRAVSADGKSVYFTAAGTGQLYLRRNATAEPSPVDLSGKCTDLAKACTIRVSASKKTDGDGPGGTDAAGPRPAAFMGASTDGSVAFFASPEKLTNDANTGKEPKAPSLARSDITGTPASVDLDFLLAQRAAGLTVNGTHIYWASPTEDAIGRAKLNGSGALSEVDADFIEVPEVEVEPDPVGEPGVKVPFEANPRYVAVDGTHVYWTNATNGKDSQGMIGRAKLGATEAEEIDNDFITGAHNPQGIAVNATHVFWANAGEKVETRTIGRAKLGATEAEEVLQGFVQVDVGSQEWTPQGLAVNGTHIYITIETAGVFSYIFRYALDGDPDSWTLFFDANTPDLPGPRGLALDANFVYWARQGLNTIGRVKLDFKDPEREWIKEAGSPFGIAVDGAHAYWSANQEVLPNPGNDLYRFESATGKLSDLTPLASGNGAEVKGVLGASEDGSAVYFAANGVLASGATPGNCQGSFGSSLGFSGECSLYLAREGQPLAFIARLDGDGIEGDATNWLPRKTPADTLHKTSRVSPDGQTLLFRSQQQLTDYDNEGVPQFYRFKVGEGIDCVSCNPTGAPPSGTPRLGSIAPPFLIPGETVSVLSRNLSADGNRVFFQTIEALAPADTNGEAGCPNVGTERSAFPICQDVYQWEAEGTGSCKQGGGCLSLLSTGKSTSAAFFGDASLNGDHAFVFTRAKLVGQDQDQLYDVYDASVNGGLVSQNQPPPPVCTSTDGCQGATPPPPPFHGPGTEAQRPPNPKAKPKPLSCPKGKRKVRAKGKTRCVAKGKGKKGKGKRANKTGRAAR